MSCHVAQRNANWYFLGYCSMRTKTDEKYNSAQNNS